MMLIAVLLGSITTTSYSLESDEEFKMKLEELRDDPTLPRDERIRRHRQKLSLILERRKAEKEEEERRAREEAIQRKAPQPPAPPVPQTSVIQQTKGNLGAILSVEPLDIQVKKDDEFYTKILYTDHKKGAIDQLKITLKYDKRFLSPQKVYDFPLHDAFEGAPNFFIEAGRGRIVYGGKFQSPTLVKSKTAILVIKWKALEETSFTTIDFRLDDEATYITSRGEDYLGTNYNPKDGVISSGITIRPSKTQIAAVDFSPIRHSSPLSTSGSISSESGLVGLEFEISQQPSAKDKTVVVDVNLLNPYGSMLDDVSLYLRFDQAALEVIDWDKGNWIRRGVNIYDGFAHETYPFNFHKMNMVYNDTGEIKYWMGLGDSMDLPTGTIARIKFKIKDTYEFPAVIRFAFSEDDSQPTTDVCHFGGSVLDKEHIENNFLLVRLPPGL